MHAVTDNDSWEEWSGKIYPADPAYYNFTIKGASKEKYKIVVDGMTTYQFINVDGEWYYDVNTYYGWPAKGSLAINIFYTRK